MSRLVSTPFAITPEWVLDAEISDRAVRLYGVLARHADKKGAAYPSHRALAERLRCGVTSVRDAIRELRDIGALTVEKKDRADGGQTANLYRLHADPPVATATPPRREGDSPPVGEAPPQEEREPEEREPSTLSSPHGDVVLFAAPSLFDQFWDVYPRKIGKRGAVSAWKAALRRGADPEQIIGAARRYRDRPGREDRYTAHPTTWLNQGRYDDEEPETSGSPLAGVVYS